jgi:hypothetical protein
VNSFGYNVDFALENERGLREMWRMLKNFPLSVGHFTDAGYRFKKN